MTFSVQGRELALKLMFFLKKKEMLALTPPFNLDCRTKEIGLYSLRWEEFLINA